MKTSTHHDVSQRAYYLWEEKGRPEGQQTAIWLEAEQQLTAGAPDSGANLKNGERARTTNESKGASSLAAQVKAETAAESTVEYHISPPVSEDAAIQAALQKKDARAPQHATKNAPHAVPAETGKPLWSKPHSS